MSKNAISASATALPDRRFFLAAAPAVAIMGALARPAHANQHQHDDEFRRLSAEYEAVILEFRRSRAERLPLEAKLDAQARDYTGNLRVSFERFLELRETIGVEAAIRRENEIALKVDAINEQIRALPTLSVYAIAVKLKILHFDISMEELETDDLEEMDWDQACYVRLLREVEALAAGAIPQTA